jgi:replication-associated recombination protein RarA
MMLWVEKYRPKTLDDLVLADDNRSVLDKFLKEGEIPHLLLEGITGSGKTTVARILTESISCSVLQLNASDDRGIDVVRDRIKPFLQTLSMNKWKVVFLDEADALTPESCFALRSIIEKFSDHGRFIMTANHPEKIHEAVRSRCQEIFFRPLDRKLVTRLLIKILKAEEIEFEPTDVVALIDDYYPDIRKIINQAERRTQGGKMVYSREETLESKLIDLLKDGKLRPIRELVLAIKPDFVQLYRYLFDVIAGQYSGVELRLSRRQEAAIAIAEYAYRDAIVPDRELQFAACCLKVMELK